MSTQQHSKIVPIFLKDQKIPSMLHKPLAGGTFMADIERVSDFQIELKKYNDDVEHALNHAKKVSIDTDEDATTNVDFAGKMRKLSKNIESTKKEITAPAREFTLKVNSLANAYVEKLEDAINLISSKVGKYNTEKLEAQTKELEIQALIEEATGISADSSFIPVKANTKAESAGTYQTTEWDIQIDDLSKVPLQYLTLDEALVKAAIKSGRSDIPGLVITEKKVTRIRAR